VVPCGVPWGAAADLPLTASANISADTKFHGGPHSFHSLIYVTYPYYRLAFLSHTLFLYDLTYITLMLQRSIIISTRFLTYLLYVIVHVRVRNPASLITPLNTVDAAGASGSHILVLLSFIYVTYTYYRLALIPYTLFLYVRFHTTLVLHCTNSFILTHNYITSWFGLASVIADAASVF